MDDNSIKGICLSLFFLDTMFFGCLPYLLVGKSGSAVSPRSARIRTTITSYLNCFAGGVFLGACLLHLMVEGRETLDEYFALANKDVDFPVYECVAAAGFFLIALIEQLAHKCLEHADTDLHQDVSIIENQGGIQLSQLSATNGGHVNTLSYISTESDNIILNNSGAENGSAADRQGVKDGTQVNPLKTESDANSTSRGPQAVHVPTSFNDDLEKKTGADMFKMMEVRPMRAFLLLGAFSFHTVFDGLAVGLQQDSSNIWQMFAAICIHKSLVALSLGLQLFLVFRKKPMKAFICIFLFSFISPIGVGTGMAVSSADVNPYAKTLSRGVLEGLSTGTFFYVAFFEILHEELAEKRGLLRLALVILGFGGTAVAKVFDSD